MPQAVQSNISPTAQELYRLVEELNEHQLVSVLNFIKRHIEKETAPEIEEEKLAKKRAAFARLMELREEIAAANLPSVDEIRREAIEEKYGYMLSQKGSDV